MNAPAGQPPADPLAALKPIALPAEPSWWPPALGWWLLAGALLAAIATAIWWWRRRQRHLAPLRQALELMQGIEQLSDPEQQLRELNRLLRRAALQRHGFEPAARGPQAWATFLASHAPPDLQQSQWQELADAPYRPQTPQRTGELLALGRAWLRHTLTC